MAHDNKLGNPGHDYEKNVNIQSPLDANSRVEIGGYIGDRILLALEQIRESNELIYKEVRLMNDRMEIGFQTNLTNSDIEEGD